MKSSVKLGIIFMPALNVANSAGQPQLRGHDQVQ